MRSIGNREKRQTAHSGATRIAATIINGMKPEKFGRVLGTGMRVAGRIAGQRIAGSTQPAVSQPQGAGLPARAVGQNVARATVQTSRGVARGIGGFLRPFGRVGGILWLEVTGVFFFLFALVFVRSLWIHKESWAQGPDHQKFLGSAALLLLFLYLAISSFWRARRR